MSIEPLTRTLSLTATASYVVEVFDAQPEGIVQLAVPKTCLDSFTSDFSIMIVSSARCTPTQMYMQSSEVDPIAAEALSAQLKKYDYIRVSMWPLDGGEKKTVFKGRITKTAARFERGRNKARGAIFKIFAICESGHRLIYKGQQYGQGKRSHSQRNRAARLIRFHVETGSKSKVNKFSNTGSTVELKQRQYFPVELPLEIVRRVTKEAGFVCAIHDDYVEYYENLAKVVVGRRRIAKGISAVEVPFVLKTSLTESNVDYYMGISNRLCKVEPFDIVSVGNAFYIVINIDIRLDKDSHLDVKFILISITDVAKVTAHDIDVILEEELDDRVTRSMMERELFRSKGSEIASATAWNTATFEMTALVFDKHLAAQRLPAIRIPENILLDDVDISSAGAEFKGIPFASPALYPKAGEFYPVLSTGRYVLLNIGDDKDEPVPVAMVLRNRPEDRITGIQTGDRVSAHPISSGGIRDIAGRVQLDVRNADGKRSIRATGVQIDAAPAAAGVDRDVDLLSANEVILGDWVNSKLPVPGSLLVPAGPRRAVRTGDQITVSLAWGAWLQGLAAAAGFATPIPGVALGEPTTGSAKTFVE